MLLFFILVLWISPPRLTLSLNQDGSYLRQAKLGLSDPTHSLSSWTLHVSKSDDTPCDWRGVECDASAAVVSVDLTGFLLDGPFPSVLCRLRSLTFLSLSNNSINASLSSHDFAACRNLRHLDLSENFLVGSIPDSLSELPNLRYLDLSGNNFSGEIPSTFGRFRRLESLNLAGNLLTGTIPFSLGNVSTLRELRLAYNLFSPSRIPSQLGNLSGLEVLWLSGCGLLGPLPPTLSRLTRLVNLDLSTNQLTGSISGWITELKSVEQIELYNNSFSGELPKGMANMTKLRRFDASTNKLSGTIPDGLTRLELESLNLYENRLEGTLPESITRSKSLSELRLFNNKLGGELPSQLGANSPLKYVDLSYNQFSGQLPTNLCGKGMLEDLVIIYNSFSGNIPENLEKCRSLTRVRLRNNMFSGHIPEEFWGLPRLYLLELTGNSFTGRIAQTISGATNLMTLLISKNGFSGSIPDGLGSLNRLVEISGSENGFTGEIPGSLANLRQLSKLDLSKNQLSGEIPGGIRGWKNLNELNLAHNNLSGEIPTEIGSLPVLNYLDLSGNQISGEIPLELENLKLNLLNLSNNQLSGEVPTLYAKDTYRSSFLGNPGLCSDHDGLCPKTADETKNVGHLWILLTIFALAGLVLVVGVVLFVVKYRRFKSTNPGFAISKWRSFHKLRFSELEIVDRLKEGNVIGSGASGKVYKVKLRTGEVVAVKKLNGGSKEDNSGNKTKRDEFEAEVDTLGMIRHKSIVRLWCCGNSGDCRLLVYEYMPNGSLADVLHGNKRGLLGWPARYRIALDAAEGLSYLHHDCVPPIVHRDVKSNNILLDGEFGAKIADFGVAKIADVGSEKVAGSMSVIAGSCGYIAPEYAYTLRVNEKSDIYSFGMVLLELITGRPPVDAELGEKDLVKWVCTTLDQKGVEAVVDPTLGPGFKEEISRVIHVALLCTSTLPINRPSMRKVVTLLQEVVAGGHQTKPNAGEKDGELSPYYADDVSDQGSCVLSQTFPGSTDYVKNGENLH